MKNVLRGLAHYAVVATLFSAPILVLLLPVHLILLQVAWHGTWYGMVVEIACGVTSLYLGLIVLTKGLELLDNAMSGVGSRMSDH